MVKPAVSILFLLLLSGCVTTQVAQLNREPEKVKIYMSALPERPYTEISFIQADGGIFHSNEKLLRKLVERAEKEGADALIMVEFGYQHWWPYVNGVAVDFKD